MSDAVEEGGGAGRAATALAWSGGGALGLVISYGLVYFFGEAYPSGVGTFVLFAAGALGFMALADKLGRRALKVLGPISGILLALALVLVVTIGFSGLPS
ncbi:MAG: hypothetical protein GW913_03935 [Myxococcales bacterium]|nr:hypothetical protein [Myxococcales bacterium]